ncbi:MAG: hypothetical protein AAF683_09670 [Pseudomonadota bacterium]
MTANGTAGPAPVFISNLVAFLQRGWRLMGRLMIGGLFILGAGVVALATAFLGLLIAFAAIIIRYTRVKDGLFRQSRETKSRKGDSFTLEARRTAHGWTVE